MFGIHDFGLFLAAGILLNLTPGPDTVYRSRPRSGHCFRARHLRRQYFSYLCRSPGAFGNSRDLGARFWCDQVARRRIPDFSWDQNGSRSTQAFEFAVQLSAANDRGSISPRSSHEHSESQSGALFSRLSSTIHRPGVEGQGIGVPNARVRIRHHRNNLVSCIGAVRVGLQPAIAQRRKNQSMAESNSRCAVCFPRSAIGYSEVMVSMLSDDVL